MSREDFYCIVCDRTIKYEYGKGGGGRFDGWPDKAVQIETTGNYGSTVFDLSGVLTFFICDSCILKRRHRMFWAPPATESGGRLEYVPAICHFDPWMMLMEGSHGP